MTAKIYELDKFRKSNIGGNEKNMNDYHILFSSSGRVRTDYDKEGIRIYIDTKTGEIIPQEDLSNFLDDNIKNPKNFMDSFERNLLFRGL